ncbi:restriction endonuclease [Corallococcus sp. CA047B]|uniref:restriction endonuclease n=1 Tax=Corallococcus sp. CA047B TaxID=2316729 RepID=UPI000EA28E2F|nr:restriction endonuclease [Corallococcus sp. CA047B]RKH19144.1 restriction endonuclease [Corallococcus sp. CA047B]
MKPKKSSRSRRISVAWEEYERQVNRVLQSARHKMDVRILGKSTLKTSADEEYEVDVYAEFELFGGAKIKVIVECKHYNRRVERERVMSLHRKTQELGAHKAMLFSVSGFQKGAIEYARKHGIALVQLTDKIDYRAYHIAYGPPSSTARTRFLVSDDPCPEQEPVRQRLTCELCFATDDFLTFTEYGPARLFAWLRATTPAPTRDVGR